MYKLQSTSQYMGTTAWWTQTNSIAFSKCAQQVCSAISEQSQCMGTTAWWTQTNSIAFSKCAQQSVNKEQM